MHGLRLASPLAGTSYNRDLLDPPSSTRHRPPLNSGLLVPSAFGQSTTDQLETSGCWGGLHQNGGLASSGCVTLSQQRQVSAKRRKLETLLTHSDTDSVTSKSESRIFHNILLEKCQEWIASATDAGTISASLNNVSTTKINHHIVGSFSYIISLGIFCFVCTNFVEYFTFLYTYRF